MHEFPEVQKLVQSALTQARPNQRIKRLVILVGEASGISPQGIEHYFPTAARDTAAEGALLEFRKEKLAAHCAQCAAQFNPAGRALSCPKCGAKELVITAGQLVKLLAVETH